MGIILDAEVGLMTETGVAVCFRHAVLRAMKGQEIKMFIEESRVHCDDCLDEGIERDRVQAQAGAVRLASDMVEAIRDVFAPALRRQPAKPTGDPDGLGAEAPGQPEPDRKGESDGR